MDAFFISDYNFVHPYTIKLWTVSQYENAPFLLTYDGVKLRLFDFLTHKLLKERDFLCHDTLSSGTTIYSSLYPSRCIFVLVRDRRNLVAFDDNLNMIKQMSFDTNVIVLSKVWSDSDQTLYVSGNFGWIRAIELTIKNSISGTIATWSPKWSVHEKNMWVQNLTINKASGFLIGSSGTEVICFNISDGSIAMRFQSQHTMDISSICVSDKRLILYTAAPDGMIKGWRLFDRNPVCTIAIKQAQLGQILMKLDDTSLITISHERVLRRYRIMSSLLIAELNLDVTKTNEEKDVESPIFLDVVKVNKRNFVLESEGFEVRLFEALYAPSELGICCDVVCDIIVDAKNTIYALCKNNVMHELHVDGSDGAIFDLDQMDVKNLNDSHVISQRETCYLKKDDLLYIGYAGGQIRVFNLKTHTLNEMLETNKEVPVSYFCTAEGCFPDRHNYCPAVDCSYKYMVISDSYAGSFTVHCARCFNFVGSWELTYNFILKLEQIPDTKIFICLEKERISLIDFTKGFIVVDYDIFDELDTGYTFLFATDDIICVAMQGGKAYMYRIDVENKKLIHTSSLKFFESKISQIVSCKDLENIDNGKESIEKYDLKGIVCALSVNNRFVVADALTGIIQYSLNFPEHKENGRFNLVLIGSRPFIILSVDQNMRLLAFPNYKRVVPQVPSEEEDNKSLTTGRLKSFTDDEDEADIEEMNNTPYIFTPNRSPSKDKIKEEKTPLKREYTQEIIDSLNTTRIVIPEGDEKKAIRFKYQNGWPSIVVENLEEEEEEEEEEEKEKEEEITSKSYEFTQREEVFINDIIKQNKEKTADEVDKINRSIYERIMANNPEVKEKFETKPLKSISQVEYYYDDDEEYGDFYDTFLTIDVKSLQPKKYTRPNSEYGDYKPKFDLFNRKKPKGIKPIKIRKPKKIKPKKYIILEFKDGTKVRADEKTAALLKSLTESEENQLAKEKENYNTPGIIFQKALRELDKEKRSTPKKLIIREQQLLALPIQTLTSGGFSIGASNKRYFKKAPFSKFVVNQVGGSNIISMEQGVYKEAKFFHWEGVAFDNESKLGEKKKRRFKKLVSYGVYEEEEEWEEEEFYEEDEEEGERTSRSKKLSKENNTSTSSDLPSGDLFDKNNPKAAKILNNSPRIQAIDKLFGDSDNPLLDFLNQQPNFSTDDIISEINNYTPEEVDWHPMKFDDVKGTTNVFNVVGLSGIHNLPENERIPSPRVMDPWKIVSMTGYAPTDFGLMTINEMSDDNSSASDLEISEGDDIFEETPKSKPLTQAQSFIQMHLRRNDFQALHDILDEEGLIDSNDIFVNVPKWQPAISYVPRHIKIPGPFEPNLTQEKSSRGMTRESKSGLSVRKRADTTPGKDIKKSTSNGAFIKGQIVSGSDKVNQILSPRSKLVPSPMNTAHKMSIDDLKSAAEGETINEENEIVKEQKEDEFEEISDIEDDDDNVVRIDNQYDYYEEEEIYEEEEEVIDEHGEKHITYKISKGIVKKFKRQKIGDAKTRKTTDYSNIKYEHEGGRRKLYTPEETKKVVIPEPEVKEKKPRSEYELPEGLQIKAGSAKKIKVHERKKVKVKSVKVSKEMKLKKKEEKPKRVKKPTVHKKKPEKKSSRKRTRKPKHKQITMFEGDFDLYIPVKKYHSADDLLKGQEKYIPEEVAKSEGASASDVSEYEFEAIDEGGVYEEEEESKFEEEEDAFVYVYEEEYEYEDPSFNIGTNIAEQFERIKKTIPTSARDRKKEEVIEVDDISETDKKKNYPEIILNDIPAETSSRGNRLSHRTGRSSRSSKKDIDSNKDELKRGGMYIPTATGEKRRRRRRIVKKNESVNAEEGKEETKCEEDVNEYEDYPEEEEGFKFEKTEEEQKVEEKKQEEDEDKKAQIHLKPRKRIIRKKSIKRINKVNEDETLKKQKEDEERAMKFLEDQTVEAKIENLDFETDLHDVKPEEIEIVEEKRSDHLGEEVELHLLGEEMSGFESKCVIGKSKLLRSNSTNSLFKEKVIDKKVVPMFGEVDLSYAEEIFLEHYAPSLFQPKTGKLRRNSV